MGYWGVTMPPPPMVYGWEKSPLDERVKWFKHFGIFSLKLIVLVKKHLSCNRAIILSHVSVVHYQFFLFCIESLGICQWYLFQQCYYGENTGTFNLQPNISTSLSFYIFSKEEWILFQPTLKWANKGFNFITIKSDTEFNILYRSVFIICELGFMLNIKLVLFCEIWF